MVGPWLRSRVKMSRCSIADDRCQGFFPQEKQLTPISSQEKQLTPISSLNDSRPFIQASIQALNDSRPFIQAVPLCISLVPGPRSSGRRAGGLGVWLVRRFLEGCREFGWPGQVKSASFSAFKDGRP